MSGASSVLLGVGLAGLVAVGVFSGGDRTAAAGVRPVVATRAVDGAPEAPVTCESVVDQKRLLFRENEDSSRVVAEVTATLVRSADGLRLRVVASAIAPLVVPGPGWRGVAGSNRITAEEMGALLDRGALSIVSTQRCTQRKTRGEVVVVRRGPLVERTLDARGVVEETESREALALEATLVTAPLTRGSNEVTVLADGKPRVRVVVSGRPGAERIIEVLELDGDGVVVRAP